MRHAVAWKHILCVRELRASHVRKALLYALASRANEDGECWPSIRTLCRDSGLAERTVQAHLQGLIDRHLLIRHERRGKAALLRLTLDTTRTGAADAPVHATTVSGACAAPYPRTACAKPPQGVHPKLKEKEPRRLTANHHGAEPLDASTGPEEEGAAMKWWETNLGVDNKARELGVMPHPGESYPAFKVRVFSANKLQVAREKVDSRRGGRRLSD